MALRVRYHYETSFFDARPADADDAADQVDDAINHPILQRLAGKVQRRDASTAAQRRSSFSSLGASVSSLEEEEQAGRFESVATLLNRSRSLQHRRQCGAFSLHLSPTARTRIGECVLSPISDKSENDATQDAAPSTAAATPPALHRRRPRHLAPLVFAKSDAKAALNGSDSGISISANSLETSASDALPVRCLVQKATTGSLSSNSHGRQSIAVSRLFIISMSLLLLFPFVASSLQRRGTR